MKITRCHTKNDRRIMTYKTLSLAAAISLAGLSQSVLSGGFQLSDHSVTSLGRAHAGYGVFGDDASSAHYNPAGMSLLKQRQLQIGGSHSHVEGEYTPDNSLSGMFNQGNGADGATDALVPNIYFVMPINDRINFGLGVTAPYGTNTDYASTFAGQYSGLQTELKTIDINPSFSFQINDVVSIGAGVSYQTLEAILSAAANPSAPGSQLKIDGDSDNFGYNVGVMFNFSDDSRLGISYRSEIDHDIEGSSTFSGFPVSIQNDRFSATSQFTSPETAYIGYVNPINEKWTLSLGARWTGWSSFKELKIDFPDAATATAALAGLGGQLPSSTIVDTEWNDSWTTMIGADYKLNSQWTLRAGYGDDQTPVPNATRSVRTVDSDRTWYSIGASYISSNTLQFDFAYRYIEFDNAPVNRTTGPGGAFGNIVGSFDNINIHTFAVQANYKF